VLIVIDPLITSQPARQEREPGQSVTFSVTAIGTEPLGYQWWKNGAPLAEAILIGSVALIFYFRRMRIEAVYVLATISSVVLTAILKVLVGRPRPPLYPPNPVELFLAIDQYSFPSGHVLFFVVFFGFMACLGWVHLTGWLRWLVPGVCAFLIVAIAPSRIYVGAHWASDVIGSYVIGTLLLIILILLYGHTVQMQRTVAT